MKVQFPKNSVDSGSEVGMVGYVSLLPARLVRVLSPRSELTVKYLGMIDLGLMSLKIHRYSLFVESLVWQNMTAHAMDPYTEPVLCFVGRWPALTRQREVVGRLAPRRAKWSQL